MNKKGFAVLEIIFAIAMLGILVTAVTGFKSYLANHEADIIKQEEFYTNVDKELTKLYSEEWDYENKTIEMKSGNLEISMINLGNSEYGTDIMEVTFETDELKQIFEIERSEYYHE